MHPQQHQNPIRSPRPRRSRCPTPTPGHHRPPDASTTPHHPNPQPLPRPWRSRLGPHSTPAYSTIPHPAAQPHTSCEHHREPGPPRLPDRLVTRPQYFRHPQQPANTSTTLATSPYRGAATLVTWLNTLTAAEYSDLPHAIDGYPPTGSRCTLQPAPFPTVRRRAAFGGAAQSKLAGHRMSCDPDGCGCSDEGQIPRRPNSWRWTPHWQSSVCSIAARHRTYDEGLRATNRVELVIKQISERGSHAWDRLQGTPRNV